MLPDWPLVDDKIEYEQQTEEQLVADEQEKIVDGKFCVLIALAFDNFRLVLFY